LTEEGAVDDVAASQMPIDISDAKATHRVAWPRHEQGAGCASSFGGWGEARRPAQVFT